jgi:hypothetical protein
VLAGEGGAGGDKVGEIIDADQFALMPASALGRMI